MSPAELPLRVREVLARFLATERPALTAITADLGPVLDAVADLVLDGGKRLRPVFCYWGWRGAGGADSGAVVAAAASLELVHACALVHDDVMDGSDVRRGRPAVHRRFAALHRAEGWAGDADAFGRAAAILVGDLCLVWADRLLDGSGLAAGVLHRARAVYDEMRVELMAGQYLDVLDQARGATPEDPRGDGAGGDRVGGDGAAAGPRADVARALLVARHKSAKYTIERPLHLGAALAGAPRELVAAYTAYGVPLGEAFQLRDDVLGVFGDPAETGKPAGDDLREGKRTALVAATLARATPAQAAVLRRGLGDRRLDAAGVAELRRTIAETGALAEVEDLIASLAARARAAIDAAPVAEPARAALRDLAGAVTDRSA